MSYHNYIKQYSAIGAIQPTITPAPPTTDKEKVDALYKQASVNTIYSPLSSTNYSFFELAAMTAGTTALLYVGYRAIKDNLR
jgi:hypothetical protein